jgi:ABC-type multidrug transport system permease subunit
MTLFFHYLKRTFKDPVGLLVFILVPVAIITIINLVVTDNVPYDYERLVNGYNPDTTVNTLLNVLLFVMIGCSYVSDYIHLDLRSDRRWRLLAAPVSVNKYLVAAIFASFTFTVVSGFIVLAFGYFAFNVYIGNLWMIAIVIFVMALFAQFLGIILGLTTKNKSANEAAQHIIIWPMLFLSGLFGDLNIPVLSYAFQNYSPFVLGSRAIYYSGIFNENMMGEAFTQLGILAGITAVFGIAALVIGRVKKL